MKISKIKVENVIGVSSVDVSIDSHVTVFCGPNGSGKSSLSNAIKMALTGDVTRVKLKKDYKQLIKEGRRNGSVSVIGEGFSCMMDLPSGNNNPLQYPALPFCLDPGLFASYGLKERKQFLSLLTGVKPNNDMIRDRLSKRGCDLDKVDQIIPVLRAGFDSAETTARNKATEAKGSWKAVTGEAWGSQKSEGWQTPVPEHTPGQLEEIEKSLKKLDDKLAKLNQESGVLNKHRREYETNSEIIANLKRSIDKYSDDKREEHGKLRTCLDYRVTEIEKCRESIKEIEHVKTCPHCEGALLIENGGIVAYDASNQSANLDNLTKLIKQHQDERAIIEKQVFELVRLQNEANDARVRLKNYPEPVKVEDGEISELNRKILEANDKRAALMDDIRKHRETASAHDMAANANEKATEYHKEVVEWLQIADALSPAGIPGELLSETVKPVNKRLLHSAHESGMEPVQIGPDMEIYYAGRSYNLISESEKWRADAMIAEAISFVSGLKILLLDRFDVLDIPSRSVVLNWLLSIGEDLDTCLIFGTLKKPITGIDELTCHWIANGELTVTEEMAAA